MGNSIVINDDYADLLAENGLSSLDNFFKFHLGKVVDRNSKRCVYRFSLYDKTNGCDRIFYLKVFSKASFNNAVSSIYNFGRPKSQAKIEWDNANLLIENGFRSVPLVACGEKTVFGFENKSFFLSEEISDSVSLDVFFENKSVDPETRKNVLVNLAGEIRKLHESGFSYPDLYLKHIFINIKKLENNEVAFSFIDLHRLVKKQNASFYDRIRDLSSLRFSCTAVLSDSENDLWQNTYLENIKNRQLWINAFYKRINKISARRSSYKGILTRKIENENGILYINEDFYDLFCQNGIKDFKSLFNYKMDKDKLTDNPGRTVERFRLGCEKNELVFYIKKHTCTKKTDYKLSKLREEAEIEWKNHLLCEKISIPVPLVVAWGYGETKSLFVTLEVKDSFSLEHILKNDLLPKERFEKNIIIQNIAFLAKTLHEKDYCHKDFYAGHILIKTQLVNNLKDVEFYLIDLQRIKKCNYMKLRWKIKDLAQLNFTTETKSVTKKDRIKFLHYYFGVNKLNKNQRNFLNAVEAKTNRIRRHIPRVLRRKNIFSWDQIS